MGRKIKGGKKLHKGVVGLSFQFSSDWYDRSEIEEALIESCKIAEKDLKKEFSDANIEYLQLVAEHEKYLFESISEKIKKCDILAVEISDMNNNVYLETGYARGLGKHVIIYVNKNALKKNIKIASDLQGLYIERYTSINQFKIHLARQIVLTFRSEWRIKDEYEKKFELFDSFWKLKDEEEVSIVSGEVILESGPAIVQMGDKDAFSEVTITLTHLYPDLTIKRYSCTSLPASNYSGNVICIGGPNSNTVTRTMINQANIDLKFKRIRDDWIIKGHHPKKILYKEKELPVQPEYESNKIIKEILCIMVGPNPFNLNKRVVILFGIHTYGVLGATNVVTGTGINDLDHANMEYIIENLSETEIKTFLCPVPLINKKCIIGLIGDNMYVI
jgi:nucleoside 2-deoxyribosyltransferase